MTSTEPKILNRPNDFTRIVRIERVALGAAEEVLERDVNITRALAIGNVGSNERSMHVLNDKCDDLTIQAVHATLYSKGNKIGGHDVTETISFTVERVSELAQSAQLPTKTMLTCSSTGL